MMRSAAVLLLCALCACGDSSAAKKDDVVNEQGTLIGPEGGELTAHGVVLRIPAGALKEPQTIRIEERTENPVADLEALTSVYTFLPDGLTFEVPVEVRFTLRKPAAAAVVMWTLAGSDKFAALDTQSTGSSVTTQVEHFSQGFVAAAGSELADAGASLDGAPNAEEDAMAPVSTNDAGSDGGQAADAGACVSIAEYNEAMKEYLTQYSALSAELEADLTLEMDTYRTCSQESDCGYSTFSTRCPDGRGYLWGGEYYVATSLQAAAATRAVELAASPCARLPDRPDLTVCPSGGSGSGTDPGGSSPPMDPPACRSGLCVAFDGSYPGDNPASAAARTLCEAYVQCQGVAPENPSFESMVSSCLSSHSVCVSDCQWLQMNGCEALASTDCLALCSE